MDAKDARFRRTSSSLRISYSAEEIGITASDKVFDKATDPHEQYLKSDLQSIEAPSSSSTVPPSETSFSRPTNADDCLQTPSQQQADYEAHMAQMEMETCLQRPFIFEEIYPCSHIKVRYMLIAPENPDNWAWTVLIQRWYQSIGNKLQISAKEFYWLALQGKLHLEAKTAACEAARRNGMDHDIYNCFCIWRLRPDICLMHKWALDIVEELGLEMSSEGTENRPNGDGTFGHSHFVDGTWSFPKGIVPEMVQCLPLPFSERQRFFYLAHEHWSKIPKLPPKGNGIGPRAESIRSKRTGKDVEIGLKKSIAHKTFVDQAIKALRETSQELGKAMKSYLSEEYSVEEWSQIQQYWDESLERERNEAEWAAEVQSQFHVGSEQVERDEIVRKEKERMEEDQERREREQEFAVGSRASEPHLLDTELNNNDDDEIFRSPVRTFSNSTAFSSSSSLSREEEAELLKPDKSFVWADDDDEDKDVTVVSPSNFVSEVSMETQSYDASLSQKPETVATGDKTNFLEVEEADDTWSRSAGDVFDTLFDSCPGTPLRSEESIDSPEVRVLLWSGDDKPQSSLTAQVIPALTSVPEEAVSNENEDILLISTSELLPAMRMKTSASDTQVFPEKSRIEEDELSPINSDEGVQKIRNESPIISKSDSPETVVGGEKLQPAPTTQVLPTDDGICKKGANHGDISPTSSNDLLAALNTDASTLDTPGSSQLSRNDKEEFDGNGEEIQGKSPIILVPVSEETTVSRPVAEPEYASCSLAFGEPSTEDCTHMAQPIEENDISEGEESTLQTSLASPTFDIAPSGDKEHNSDKVEENNKVAPTLIPVQKPTTGALLPFRSSHGIGSIYGGSKYVAQEVWSMLTTNRSKDADIPEEVNGKQHVVVGATIAFVALIAVLHFSRSIRASEKSF